MDQILMHNARVFDGFSAECPDGMEVLLEDGLIRDVSDLLGATYVHQCREFELRSEVFTPLEILRQATSINAEILMQQNKLGCVNPGAHADLLVVDGDPLQDIGLLVNDGRDLSLIIRAGEIVRNRLA